MIIIIKMLLIVLLFGMLNLVRGLGSIRKVIAYALMTTALYSFGELTLPTTTMVFVGLWVGFAPGWGKYFCAKSGHNTRAEKEFLPVDIILDRLNIVNNYLYGVIGMSLRFLVCFLPLYLGLAVITHSLVPLFSWLLLVLQGPMYHLAGRLRTDQSSQQTHNLAEVLTGLTLGLSLSICAV